MNILTFSTLYPNPNQTHHGVFVENRLRHLIKDTGIQSVVVAPVPYFPFKTKFTPHFNQFVGIPFHENRHQIDIYHPRYLVIPKIGMYLTPYMLFKASEKIVGELIKKHKIELIDAHYFYPDGIAAHLLAKKFGLPFTITSRGTDLNLIPQDFLAKKMIKNSSEKAAHLMTVSKSLETILHDLGTPIIKTTTLRNGIDTKIFKPLSKPTAKKNIKFLTPALISVGHLIERKGHDKIIQALSFLDQPYHLYIIGTGPDEKYLKDLTNRLNLEKKVHFLGKVSHNDLYKYYSAADCMILASSREGWPNVILEAMACGTPVIANNVNGAPEIITSSKHGLLMPNRKPETIAKSIKKLFKSYPNSKEIVNYAKKFSWYDVSMGQKKIFEKILSKR